MRAAPLALSVVLLCACGAKESEPLIGPGPTTVGTVSGTLAAEPVVEDAAAVRSALESGQADEAVAHIYDLLNRAAAKKDVRVGARMIRSELPAYVRTLSREYPLVRARVIAVKPRSAGGVDLKKIGVYALDGQVSSFRSLAADVEQSELTWGAVQRWGTKSEAFRQRLGQRIEQMVARLPPDQAKALRAAAQQTFGTPSG